MEGVVPPVDGLHPHFVLVPFFAQGHTIPLLDFAHLLADRGVHVTFVTTPVNAARIRTTIDRAQTAGLPIRFLELGFPCAEAGLPEGCENVDLLPSLEAAGNFFHATSLLRQPLVDRLRGHQQPPPPPLSCIVSDKCQPWTVGVAKELGIPRLAFSVICCFSLACIHNMVASKMFDGLTDDSKPCVVPGLPHRIEIAKCQTPLYFETATKFENDIRAADEASDGFVVNTFDDLEPLYVDSCQKATGKKVWAIGPVCLYNKDVCTKATRGNDPSADGLRCLAWLDSMAPSSVIYVSFGSGGVATTSQHIEIGAGLEASNHPFVWSIKPREETPQLARWLSDGFEERTKGRGFVIRGWAPQVAILSHPAVGGFLTHCGWNSSLEGISAGLPLLTWPYFAEQFLNERLIVDVLRVGVAGGVKTQMGGEGVVQVGRDGVAAAVRELMDGGEEGEERRRRARELGKKAREAMQVGGSSYDSMTRLIREVSPQADSGAPDEVAAQ